MGIFADSHIIFLIFTDMKNLTHISAMMLPLAAC